MSTVQNFTHRAIQKIIVGASILFVLLTVFLYFYSRSAAAETVYNFYFNGVEQGNNSTAAPHVTVTQGDPKAESIPPSVKDEEKSVAKEDAEVVQTEKEIAPPIVIAEDMIRRLFGNTNQLGRR